jgi:uridine phosphorylase
VFQPAKLLREGRRQRGRPDVPVPSVCVLDPDSDIVRHLVATGLATEHPGWACYHTTLWTFDLDGTEVGVIGCAVGAPFAVLLAEQLAVSGCELLISVTSSGSITRVAEPPYFVIIDRALRDEGTGHHYLPPGEWSDAPAQLVARLDGQLTDLAQPVVTGPTWTTDARYRETAAAIAYAEALGIVSVEMEAAALYAYATVTGRDAICIAHVTNAWLLRATTSRRGRPMARTTRSRSSPPSSNAYAGITQTRERSAGVHVVDSTSGNASSMVRSTISCGAGVTRPKGRELRQSALLVCSATLSASRFWPRGRTVWRRARLGLSRVGRSRSCPSNRGRRRNPRSRRDPVRRARR